MVTAKAVLDAGLELPGVAATVGARLHADPVALTAGPLPGVAVPAVEPVNPKPVAEAVAVLPPVPAPPRPGLDPVAVVLTINPIALVPPLGGEEAVHAAAAAPAQVELAFVGVPVAVDLHPLADGPSVGVFLLLGPVAATAVVVADEPVHGGGAAGDEDARAAGGEGGERDEGGEEEEVCEDRGVLPEVKEEEKY